MWDWLPTVLASVVSVAAVVFTYLAGVRQADTSLKIATAASSDSARQRRADIYERREFLLRTERVDAYEAFLATTRAVTDNFLGLNLAITRDGQDAAVATNFGTANEARTRIVNLLAESVDSQARLLIVGDIDVAAATKPITDRIAAVSQTILLANADAERMHVLLTEINNSMAPLVASMRQDIHTNFLAAYAEE